MTQRNLGKALGALALLSVASTAFAQWGNNNNNNNGPGWGNHLPPAPMFTGMQLNVTYLDKTGYPTGYHTVITGDSELYIERKTSVIVEGRLLDNQGNPSYDTDIVAQESPGTNDSKIAIESINHGNLRIAGLNNTEQYRPVQLEVRSTISSGFSAPRIRLRIGVNPIPFRGFTYPTAEACARRAYLGVLGREADPVGLGGYANDLVRQNSPKAWENALRNLANSPEWMQNQSGKSAEDIVTTMYRGLLGRDPDTSGLGSYVPMIQRGQQMGGVYAARAAGDVAVAIGASTEFYDRILGEMTK